MKETITVGIPTYNEEKVIGAAILSALKQISEKDEIIVVASGCTDNTVGVVKKLAKSHKQIQLITESERRGKASALNIILKRAKGDIIVQTDGDVTIGKNAINYLLKHFKDQRVGAVSGRPIPVIPAEHLFYNWSQMSYNQMHKIRLKESANNSFWHVSGYLFAHRKEAVDQLPLSIKGSTDGVMGYVIRSKGYKIIYEPRAKVYVKCPLTIRDFINQKARARAGFYQLKKNYGIPPRTIKTELIKILPKQVKQLTSFKDALFFSASGLVYLIAWVKGWWFIKTNKSLKTVWKPIYSTKI